MTNPNKITLISHVLCPYVQRAVIALNEKNIEYERIDIDLADKPNWFLEISPLGKTPVLKIGEVAIFESNVILEYLEDTLVNPLHPTDALERASHRSLIEFASALLGDIAGLYMAKTKNLFDAKRDSIFNKLQWIEARLKMEPWYAGYDFSLVDAVYGPVFRYFDVFAKYEELNFYKDLPKIENWRKNLSNRTSVQKAVSVDYPNQLHGFLLKKESHLSFLMKSVSI